MGHYERLSYLDNSFLAIESRTTHMHVAGIALFDASSVLSDDGGIDIDRIRRYVASKLHLIPRYRQRLAFVPVERHPVWVDDEHFNLEYHVRHTSLPKPGTFDQLKKFVGRVHSQQLDRSKPLWEMYVVEGVEADRFALISKVHHCMIDGMAGVDLMAVLLGLAPSDEIEELPVFRPRPVPTGAELVLKETSRRTADAIARVRSIGRLAEDARSAAELAARRIRAVSYSLGSGWLTPAAKTPINGHITPNRRFDVLQTDLAGIKAIKNALGGTVNDVILAIVAGGVRRFLQDARDFTIPDDIDFRVMAPVSVRDPSQRGTLGNQVAMWLADMPVAEPDPLARLTAIRAVTKHLRETDQAYGAATLVRMSAGAPATLVSLASRLAAAARPFNMTVTNIPGPQFPLYLLGSKMLEQYPLVPLYESHGVGVAVFSYDGAMQWGFNADFDLLADLPEFVAAVDAEYHELADLAAMAPKEQVAQKATAATKRKGPKPRPPLGTKSPAGASGAGATAPATKTAAKKPAAKKPATRKLPATKSPAKKSLAKKSLAKKSPAKRAAAKKAAAATKRTPTKTGRTKTPAKPAGT